MEDNKSYLIKIEFADNATNGASDENSIPTPNSSTPKENEASGKNEALEKVKNDNVNAAKAMLRQAVGKIAHNALNNFGNITGDYVTQQNIQAAMNELTNIGSAIAMGWAGVAFYTVDKAIEAYNYIGNLKRSEREAEFRQQRVYASTERA